MIGKILEVIVMMFSFGVGIALGLIPIGIALQLITKWLER